MWFCVVGKSNPTIFAVETTFPADGAYSSASYEIRIVTNVGHPKIGAVFNYPEYETGDNYKARKQHEHDHKHNRSYNNKTFEEMNEQERRDLLKDIGIDLGYILYSANGSK